MINLKKKLSQLQIEEYKPIKKELNKFKTPMHGTKIEYFSPMNVSESIDVTIEDEDEHKQSLQNLDEAFKFNTEKKENGKEVLLA